MHTSDVENADHHTHPAQALGHVPFTKLRSRFLPAACMVERRVPGKRLQSDSWGGRVENAGLGCVGEITGRFGHPKSRSVFSIQFPFIG